MSDSEYWRNNQNQRNFFIKYANRNQFDPLIATNWYPLTSNKIYLVQGGKRVLDNYRGSLRNAIKNLFPNIGVNTKKFARNVNL